jgi:secondary thiamine-phosphate synthase enzyme
MNIQTKRIELETTKQVEFIDVTSQVEELLQEAKVQEGQVIIFCPHTTAGLTINHNESLLLQDMARLLYKMVPIEERYSHDMFELTKNKKSDGRSNGHSHCKKLLLSTSETILVEKGELVLGERQSLLFVELDGARKRDFIVQVMGE